MGVSCPIFEVNLLRYDGGRLRRWHGGRWSSYSEEKWQPGDIVGCCVDLDSRKMDFYLNGEPLGEAFSNFEIGSGLVPAGTFRLSFFYSSQVLPETI